MQNFQILGRKGEGTFSEVLKAEDKTTGQLVAIKCMKKRFKSMAQVNKLREILSIRRLQSHSNIVQLNAVLFDHSSGRLALVFELMDMNLYELIKDRKQYLPDEKVCVIAYQMLKGLEYIHSHGLLHRDIKPENLLYNVNDNTLKIADFGSSRGIYCNQPFTEYISTRWYRAPECLLTDGYYSFKMDLWSAGCVLFEILALFPLFPGNNELDQLHKIHNVLGTPAKELLDKLKAKGTHMNFDFPLKKGTGLQKLAPSASPDALDLLSKLLEYDEEKRTTAKDALRHPYFKKMREMERKQKAMHRRRTGSTPKLGLFPSDGALNDGASPVCGEGKSDSSAARQVSDRGRRNSDAAEGLNASTTSLSIPMLDMPAPRKQAVETGSVPGDAGLHNNGLLPLIEHSSSPLKHEGANENPVVASLTDQLVNTAGRRYEADQSEAPPGKAGGVERRRKTRRMSLPKL